MGKALSDDVSARASARRALVLAGFLLLLAACSKDDGNGADTTGDRLETDDEATPTTTTTVVDEPPATELTEVQPIVLDLLDRYDGLVEQIVADPSLAQDRDSEVAQEFLGLFEPGSDFAEDSLDGWATWAETGIALQPVDGKAINATNLDGVIEAVSDDDVKFVKCTQQNYVKLDDGEEVETVEDLVLAGEGTAVRVDGRWKIGVLTTPAGMQGCGIGT
jgi:hypothetical protein